MELLLGKVTGYSRVDIYTRFDAPLGDAELETLRAYVKRRAAREPLQYILGETSFFGLDISLSNDVLIPRPETEELAALVVGEARDASASLRILDIGAGSGCLGLSLAKKFPSSRVTLLDVSGAALDICRENAAKNGIGNYDLLELDILHERPEGKFDIVVSNPPYIAAGEVGALEPELSYEPALALTDGGDGYRFYNRFVTILPDLLSYDGAAYMEHGLGQSQKIARVARNIFSVVSYKDFSGRERFLRFGRKHKANET